MKHHAKWSGVAGLSSSDPLLCQQKEKYSQTFDEAHVSQVVSLIDERERWREGKAGSKRERGRKMHSRHFGDFNFFLLVSSRSFST